MKQQVIDAILNEVEQQYPSIASATMADNIPYDVYQIYWFGYADATQVDWEQNRWFLLLVLAAEGLEVEWGTN